MKDNLAENKKVYTIDDLNKLEKETNNRYELINGELIMMAGGSIEHNLITLGLNKVVDKTLKDKDCLVLSNDVRLKIENKENYFYPDLMVKCGNINIEDISIENPILIAEVLSKSTEKYDRSFKLMAYQSIKDLKAYLIVNPKDMVIEVYSWIDNNPSLKLYVLSDTLTINGLLSFSVEEVFKQILGLKK